MVTFSEQRTDAQKLIDALTLDRVKKGIALLNERCGPNWVDEIDMATLQLKNGESCVLGQVYGDYEVGAEQLDINVSTTPDSGGTADYGFDIYDDSRDVESGEQYRELQEAWEQMLTELVQS